MKIEEWARRLYKEERPKKRDDSLWCCCSLRDLQNGHDPACPMKGKTLARWQRGSKK